MNDTPKLMLTWLAGFALGLVFFGGLWWTVRKAVSSRQPAIWVLGSLLIRMGIALGGLFVVSSGHWQRLASCLIGFVVARLVVIWLTRPSGEHHARPAQEVCAP